MSKDFNDLPSLSLPPGWELATKNVEALKLSEVSLPYTSEQAEYLRKVYKDMAASVPPEVMEGFRSFNEFLNRNRESLESLSKLASRFSRIYPSKDDENKRIAKEILDKNSSEPLSTTLGEVEKDLTAIQEVNWNDVDQLEEDEEVPLALTRPFEGSPIYNQAKESLGFKFKRMTKQAFVKIPIILQTTIQTWLPYAIPLYTHWDSVKREEIASEATRVQSDKLIETMETNNRFQERQIELSEQFIKNQEIIINNQEVIISQNKETHQMDNLNSQDNYDENQNR